MNDDQYKTSDLGITSYMYYQRTMLVDMDMSDPGRIQFVFDIPDAEGLEIQKKWWNGQLLVEPRAFYASLSQIKDMIYGKRRQIR